jgi:hypothetical protein
MERQTAKIRGTVHANVDRSRGVLAQAIARSVWNWEQWRDGKLIRTWRNKNLVTNQGLDHVLDVIFKAGTATAAWHVAIFENDYTPLAANTYQVPGYTESTAYAEATRPACTFGAISSQSINNSASKASFAINATKTIYGCALVGGAEADTKSDVTAGNIMYCSSKFASSVPVESGDTLKVTITLTASDV